MEMSKIIHVLIIDDHPVVLEGSKNMFKNVEGIIAYTEGNPKRALNRIQDFEFDIVLIDINMTEKNGISLSEEIKGIHKNIRIILYTGDNISAYYSLIINRKIEGIVSKTITRENLVQTIRLSMANHLVLPIDFLDYINDKLKDKYDSIKLTEKERCLINMLSRNFTNKMIAEELNVTQRSVERYLTQLFNLLNVKSRTEAVKLVHEKKMLE